MSKQPTQEEFDSMPRTDLIQMKMQVQQYLGDIKEQQEQGYVDRGKNEGEEEWIRRVSAAKRLYKRQQSMIDQAIAKKPKTRTPVDKQKSIRHHAEHLFTNCMPAYVDEAINWENKSMQDIEDLADTCIAAATAFQERWEVHNG